MAIRTVCTSNFILFFILGYSDYGEVWRSEQFDDTKDLIEICEKVWNDISPLYKKLHAYVRMRLRNYYAEKFPNYNFPKDGTIPAHLLGNESLSAKCGNIFSL